jgi:hypothetical protein
VHTRLGALAPGGKDRWWEVTCDADIETVGRALSDSVFAHGIPWLDGLIDLRACAAFLEARLAFSRACVLLHDAGEHRRAEFALGRALTQSGVREYGERLRAWGRASGLTPRLARVEDD